MIKADKWTPSKSNPEIMVAGGTKCPACGVDGLFDEGDGTIVCQECGKIFNEKGEVIGQEPPPIIMGLKNKENVCRNQVNADSLSRMK